VVVVEVLEATPAHQTAVQEAVLAGTLRALSTLCPVKRFQLLP
jgi:hypothetical protein